MTFQAGFFLVRTARHLARSFLLSYCFSISECILFAHMENSGLLVFQSVGKKGKTEAQTSSFQGHGLEVAQIVSDLWPKLGNNTIPNYKGG